MHPEGFRSASSDSGARAGHLAGAGGVVWFALVPAPANACQTCAVLLSYDLLRFGVIWFFLLGAWVVLSIVAGWRLPKNRGEDEIPRLIFAKGPLLLLFVAMPVAAVVFGLHFFALLWFPFLLKPYCLPARWLKSDRAKRQAELAPTWLRRAGKAMMAALVASIFPAYYIFPFAWTEGQVRSEVSRARSNMKTLAGIVESCETQRRSYPPARMEQRNGQRFFTLDMENLKAAAPDTSFDELKRLNHDPFALRFHANPAALFATGYPFSYFYFVSSGSLQEAWFAKKDTSLFDRVQYWHDEERFVLWSRGPDTEFSDEFIQALQSSTPGDKDGLAAFANLNYDPTNGIWSEGEVCVVRDGSKRLDQDGRAP